MDQNLENLSEDKIVSLIDKQTSQLKEMYEN